MIEVLTRKQSEFMGRIEVGNNFAFFVAETEKAVPDVYVSLDKLNGAKDKDRVVVKITQWDKKKKT